MAKRPLIRSARIVRSDLHQTMPDANSPPFVVLVELDPFPGGGIVLSDLKLQCNLRKLTDFTADPVTGTDLGTFDLKRANGDTTGRNWVGVLAAPNAHGLAAGADAPVQATVTLKQDYVKTGQSVITLRASAVAPAVDVCRIRRVP